MTVTHSAEVQIATERRTVAACAVCGQQHRLSTLAECGTCGARFCDNCSCACPIVFESEAEATAFLALP